ncbi:diphthine--ammonia ligase [Agrilus planipennis]|uniref:Diphthine--ammonia ligase n=1 Tax=Agrilus planipennis TaxID=224129 RepID=A0A1W4WQF6_AGRPL|nr:diphthine--ammonia ligase [Agrilus planipennis]
MRVAALISGGKDSCFNMLQCIGAGHEIVALANLCPKKKTEMDSYMFQSVGFEAIELMAKAMELPLFRIETECKSTAREIDYEYTSNDEVEDMFKLLEKVKKEVVINAVSVGAILSDYQRIRVENVCSRLGLVPLAFLWQRNQSELLTEMIKCEIDAIIIKVAALGLEPSRHLARPLRLVEPHLQAMNEKYGLNVCGEGGEYETLVLDCPLFSSRIIIDESEIVMHSNDPVAPVGYLRLKKLRLETKLPVLDLKERLKGIPVKDSDGYITDYGEEAVELVINDSQQNEIAVKEQDNVDCNERYYAPISNYSSVKSVDGFIWINNLTGNSNEPAEALSEALEKLKSCLEEVKMGLNDICSVTMYISDMGLFADLNKVYLNKLNFINPPCRACVQVPFSTPSMIILDAVAWKVPDTSSGENPAQRRTMHVQSVSHWAPANIGPYSQAVRIGDVTYVAGQIGLVPGSMQLVKGGLKAQCKLSLRHVHRILRAVDASLTLRDVVQGVCYVTDLKHVETARSFWEEKTENAIVDYVVVPVLPRNALIEWHVWAHKHNNRFDYEETGKCVDSWSISIFRRWTIESNIAAIICKVHTNNHNEVVGPSEDILLEALQYTVQKLQQNHESETEPVFVLKIFYSVRKRVAIDKLIESLNEMKNSFPLAYTVVPVTDLCSESTYLSISGIRNL